ncbi:MAG: LacI family DNA-binding transcriptional regulator [Lachnospiraceae bacterium]|nr:LacI family DNA-binding transcriptional regulator [Lachnospiraceae bacterium]
MNIREIAKMAGVSPAAVSRYLNNGYISREKSDAIKKVIDETGYMPSHQAQTLRTGKTKLIGVIIPRINSDSISSVVAGVSEVLTAEGYQLILANTDNDADKEIDYLETFKQTNVDGIIHLGTIKSAKHKKAFKAVTTPLVVLGQESESASCIFHDDYGASFSLTDYVLSKNHKHIAYIGVTEKDIAVGYMRKQGFLDAMEKAGLHVPKNMLYQGNFRMDNGYSNAEKILKDHPDVDAIICATDTIALGAIKYLNEHHISIPDQVGVAGFGDSKTSSVLSPSLTTVHFYYKECGIEGAKLLLERIQNENSSARPSQAIKLDYRIIENQSI